MGKWIQGARARLVPGLAGALIAVHAFILWSARPGRVGTGGDDAFYILLARSIRQGSYREIHRFDHPVHSQYPPGYPALLALGGDYANGTDAATAIGIVAAVITVAILFDLCRRTASPVFALVALTLAVLNPLTIDRTTGVYAEAAFTAVTMVGLWLSVRFRSTRLDLIGASAAAIAATMFRSVGVALVGAIFIARLLDRQGRFALRHAVAAAVTLGPWFIWTFLAPKPAVDRSYVASLTHVIQKGTYGPVRSALQAAKVFVTQSFPLLMNTPTIEGTIVDNIYWASVVLILLVIGLVVSRRVSRIPALYFGCYVVLVGVWPYHPVRFLLPLIPVMLWLLCLAAQKLADRFRSWPLAVLGVLSVVAIVGYDIRSDKELIEHASICRQETLSGCYHERALAFFDVAAYAKKNLPGDAIVATVKEATFAYYAERSVVSHLWLVTYHNAGLLDFLSTQGIHYVLISALNPSPLPRRLKADCSRFEVIYQVPPTAYLLKLSDGGVPLERSSCAVLESWPPKQGAGGT